MLAPRKGEEGGGEGGKEGEEAQDSSGIAPIHVPNGTILPAVLSLGHNPYYANTVRSLEVHILHKFERDFYGAWMNLLICGFLREELDYTTKEALVEDILKDCEVARHSLGREGYRTLCWGGRWGGLLREFRSAEGAGKGEEGKRKEGGKGASRA